MHKKCWCTESAGSAEEAARKATLDFFVFVQEPWREDAFRSVGEGEQGGDRWGGEGWRGGKVGALGAGALEGGCLRVRRGAGRGGRVLQEGGEGWLRRGQQEDTFRCKEGRGRGVGRRGRGRGEGTCFADEGKEGVVGAGALARGRLQV